MYKGQVDEVVVNVTREKRASSAAASSKMETTLALKPTVVGLFAGIGGLEAGFRKAGYRSVMLCEVDANARKVLEKQFPDTAITNDIKDLDVLPACDVVTAGFPCQDLSQVGRRRGIKGPNSGLIEYVMNLLANATIPPTWLVLENVPFMLKLDRGRAISRITKSLEKMGWAWAYRTIDTRAFGLPQRRRRVILVASKVKDPRPVLFNSDAGTPDSTPRSNHACGFYWTEGNSGLGWAVDAIPPLKGGSALHIPSPPAIWFPQRRLIAVPSIEDAERLQGFPAGWTAPADDDVKGHRRRWRMVGNAVSVPLAEWLAKRLLTTSSHRTSRDKKFKSGPWPDAAWGKKGERWSVNVSEWPMQRKYAHLASFLEYPVQPLSVKATAGFHSRLVESPLRYEKDFERDLKHHMSKYAKKSSKRPRKSKH